MIDELIPEIFKKFQDYIYNHYKIVITNKSIATKLNMVSERIIANDCNDINEYLNFLQLKDNTKELHFFICALNLVTEDNIEYLLSMYSLFMDSFDKETENIRVLSLNAFNSIEHVFILLAFNSFKEKMSYKGQFTLYLTEQTKKQNFILHRRIFSLTEIWDNPNFLQYQHYFSQESKGLILTRDIFKNIKILKLDKALASKSVFDVVLYKNWSIFLSEEEADLKATKISKLLKNNGYLVLGKNELLKSDIFKSIHLKRMIVHKKQ